MLERLEDESASMYALRRYRDARMRIANGALDAKFSKYGKREVAEVAVAEVTTGSKIRPHLDSRFSVIKEGIRYGEVEIVQSKKGWIWLACYHDRYWFNTFLANDLDTILQSWDEVLPLTAIGPVTSMSVHALQIADGGRFKARKSVSEVDVLRRSGVSRIRFFTFDEPFMSEADRLSYLGERI